MSKVKKMEELGISPEPWNIVDTGNVECKFKHITSCENNYPVALSVDPNDAMLIAAAPELYKCLREAVVEKCHDCGNLDNEMAAYCEDFVCHDDECFVKKWRTALAKASGEGNNAT